jgi:hypothetical protein
MEDDDVQATSTDDEAPASSSNTTTTTSSGSDPIDGDAVLGTPLKSWVWLAPDWSEHGPSRKDSSWTRVQIEETKYQDGRIVTRVLDANQRPIMHQTLEERVDPKQQERYTKAKKDAERNKPAPPTKTVRGEDGKNHIMERNPETGAYDIDRGLAPNQPTAAARKPIRTYYDKDGAKVTEYDNGETTREAQSPAETRAAAAAGRPSVNIEDDGKGGKVAILTYPDGRVESKPVQGVAGKPDRVTVDGVPHEKGPDGTWAPVVQTGAADPAGAPRPQLTLGTVTRDLQSYAEFLDMKVKKGELTPQQADGLLKKRRELATSAVQEQTALINGQRGIFSDEVGQRQDDITETASRRKDAQSATNSALNTYSALLGKVSGDAFAGVVGAEIEAAHANAGRWGGLTEHPRIELPPFLQQVRNATIEPTAAQVDQQTASTIGETNAQIDRLTGGAPAPAPAPAAAAPAPTAAAPAASSGPTSPPPPGDYVWASREGQAPTWWKREWVESSQGRIVPVGDGQPAPAATPTPVNPPAGQPGNDPTAPVGMTGDGGLMARAPLASTPPPPFVDQARFGQQYSPDRVLSMLVGDPDLDTEAVLEGYKQVFGTKPKVQQAA